MKRLAFAGITVSALIISLAPGQALATATAQRSAPTQVDTQYAYQGDAYGTKAYVNGAVTSGPSAPVVLGCSTMAGVHKTNTTAGVNVNGLLNTGTIVTTADATTKPIESRTSADVQNVNLLSGVISGTEIKSVSSTLHRSSGFRTSSDGTTFTSVQVAGIPVTGAVAPNTTINVAGFGHVILNEQFVSMRKHSAMLTVNALHLVITETNSLGIPVGTNVIVAHAMSALGGPTAATLDGFAYGSRVGVDKTVSSGPSFRVILPCLGTNGRVKSDEGAGVSIQGVLQTGNIRNTATGTVDASTATAETTSTVDSSNVLSGLIQATTIVADAHASSNGNGSTFSDSGSSFATLSVQGFPNIGPNVPANTKVRIPGLGTLYLHRVIHRSDSIEVRMIELLVRHSNSDGIPVGTDIRVAVAHASAH